MSEELRLALESLKDYKMSQAEMDAQRISFVYGNASSNDHGTRESVERAIDMAEMA